MKPQTIIGKPIYVEIIHRDYYRIEGEWEKNDEKRYRKSLARILHINKQQIVS